MKPVYLIRIEVDDESRAQRAALEVARFTDHIQAAAGTWFLASRLTARQLFDRIAPVVGDAGSVFVVKITREYATCSERPITAWLGERYSPSADRATLVR